MFDTLVTVVIFAILVEAIVENVKWTVTDIRNIVSGNKSAETEWKGERLTALVLSLLFSFGFNIDVFGYLGYLAVIPYLGVIGTGIILARGSNYVYDLVGKLGKGEPMG